MEYSTLEVDNSNKRSQFIRLPWKLFKNSPRWVPPLISDMRDRLNPKKNPFFEYGKIKLFGVWDGEHEMVGRIAAIYNPVHRDIYREPAGFFGLFDCINNNDVAKRLIGAAGDYLRPLHCTHLIGPVNFTTNDEMGLLVDGFDDDPMILCNYSPPYYRDLLSACGGKKEIDMLSYGGEVGHIFPSKHTNVLSRISSNRSIMLRTFSRKNFSSDIKIIRELYNKCFKDVWGFVPLSMPEVSHMGKAFMKFFDEELVWIAEYARNPAGFILALPDVNEILKEIDGRLFPFGIFKFFTARRNMRRVRVLVLCVIPRYRSIGIETLLIHKVHSRMKNGRYRRAEFSVVMENNEKMRNILRNLGFKAVKRYRLYRIPVEDEKNSSKDPRTAFA